MVDLGEIADKRRKVLGWYVQNVSIFKSRTEQKKTFV